MRFQIILAMAIMLCPVATLANPSASIAELREEMASPPSEVMVLGTAHLSGLPSTFSPEELAPLIDRLAAFKPEIIAIEALSGADCDMLSRYVAIYPGTANDYCGSADVARQATGLDVPAATAEVKKMLDAWPSAPTAVDRRHLAALFSAANDRASALVQWLRLPETERHPGDGLDARLVEELNLRKTRMNENYQIAAVLAARLGLERVYPTDDHSSDSITATLGPDFEKAITDIWRTEATNLADYRKKVDAPAPGQGIIDYYRLLNDPASLMTSIKADFGAALKDKAPPHYGRQYVAWWETRNLRMVANIRAAFGNKPGARVLSIVGMSHKPYFDAYLGMMHEVRLVDTLTILK